MKLDRKWCLFGVSRDALSQQQSRLDRILGTFPVGANSVYFFGLGPFFGLRMVRVSFNSALGRKEEKKDAEILLPEEQIVSKNGAVVGSFTSRHAPRLSTVPGWFQNFGPSCLSSGWRVPCSSEKARKLWTFGRLAVKPSIQSSH